MDEDYRELANRLFATATAMLEDSVAIAVAGQSQKRRPADLVDCARHLHTAVAEIGIVAQAALLIARLANQGQPRRPRRGSTRKRA